MFQYEYEKRGPNAAEWGRTPPTPCERPVRLRARTDTVTSLRVWAVAGAACLVVCFIFVLATLFVSQWGRGTQNGDHYVMQASSPHTNHVTAKYVKYTDEPPFADDNSIDGKQDDIEILEKIAILKNFIANRDTKTTEGKSTDGKSTDGKSTDGKSTDGKSTDGKSTDGKSTDGKSTGGKSADEVATERNLINKPQLYPEHDASVSHSSKNIEKKDQAKVIAEAQNSKQTDRHSNEIPEFKPALPDIFHDGSEMKLPIAPEIGFKKPDYDYLNDYYEDSVYDDYMQSKSMTNYLIEKVQELHDWISNDPDFEAAVNTTKKPTENEFSAILKALNTSVVEGNASIIMNKLRDLYFDGNHSTADNSRKIILTNSTNLLSFGILTLDVLLLHNIQLMAWENQESLKNKMLRDPDVFAFSALFMDPKQVEAKRNEIYHPHENSLQTKRQNLRHDSEDDSLAKNIFESVLELGMSTARAAINLGRSYKNTKIVLSQISNRDNKDMTQNVRYLSRNADASAHALGHLQALGQNESTHSVANAPAGFHTELDCVWHLYCKNLMATTKLNPPYGVMARINGVALRMLSGELSADRALDTLLYEAMTGWTELKCSDMFPRCSKANAAAVVLESILQPLKRSHANRTS